MGAQSSRKTVWFVETDHDGNPMSIRASCSQFVSEMQSGSRSLEDSVPETYGVNAGWRSWVYASTTNEAYAMAKDNIDRVSRGRA